MKKIALTILVLINSLLAFAQHSTIIDSKSMTVPRYTDLIAIQAAITTPQTGMMVFNNGTQSYWFYNGTWTNLAASVNGTPWIFNQGGDITNANLGNVGIGGQYSPFVFPTYKLDVNGSMRVLDSAPSSSFARLTIQSNFTSILSLFRPGLIWNIGAINNNDFKIVDVSGLASERVTLKSGTGFTGINVTNPIFRLDIDGRIRIRSNANSAGLWFNNNTNSAQNTFLGIDPNNNFGIFSLALNANIFTAKMSDGFIGIGNETPNAPLQFANSGTNRKIVLYETGNNDHQFYGFGINAGVLRYQVEQVISDHVFYAGSGTSTSNELLRIKGNGNVGLGTTTPTSKFEVNGTIATKLVKINTFSNVTLDETASVWYFSSSPQVAFPSANTCENRRYVLVNISGASINFSTYYIDFNGIQILALNSNSSIEIISDGTNWLQIR